MNHLSQKAITIYTPSGSAPHISADDDAFIHHSLLGRRSGMLGELACSRVNDNTVRLSGGGVSNMGYILRIAQGECCDLTIENGASGVGRRDIIAARFTKGGADIADTHEFVVIKGTSAADPQDPALVSSELASPGDICETPLFRVELSGTSIAAITPIAQDAALPQSARSLETPVAITLAGDAQGSVTVDGTQDVTLSAKIPALSALRSYRMSLTASQTDPLALVKSKWSTLVSGCAFVIFVEGGYYGGNCLFIGEKTSESYGCMFRMVAGAALPTWHYLRSGVWGSGSFATA